MMLFFGQNAVRNAVPILAGPALFGLLLGVPYGSLEALERAAQLPLVVIGTGAILSPALYIIMAIVGEAPPLQEVASKSVEMLRRFGMLLLALSPSLLFAAATANSPSSVMLLGHLVIIWGAILTLRVFYQRTFANPERPQGALVYLLWSLAVLGVGFRGFESVLDNL